MDKRAEAINRAYYIGLGRRLALLRKAGGYSQKDIAFTLGVTYQQYQKYEKGLSRLPVDRVVIIKNLLDVPYERLLEE